MPQRTTVQRSAARTGRRTAARTTSPAPAPPASPPRPTTPHHRQSVADRVAALVARRSELGEITPCADPARRARLEADPAEWVQHYCPSLFRHAMPPHLREYAQQIVDYAAAHGGRTQVILPRGAGKSSVALGALCYLLSTGRIHHAILIAATARLASRLLTTLWHLMETSPTYAADYPEIAEPIQALRGASQRAAGQTLNGVRTRIVKTAEQAILPTIEGSAASGAIIATAGAGGAIRGALGDGGSRPEVVLLDDILTRKTATPELSRQLEEWIQADVLGLAGADTGLSLIMTCTRIRDGDLTTIYDVEHPEVTTIQHKLVEQWPTRADLWEEYRRQYLADLTLGDAAGKTAHQYYLNNRDAMDAGAVVFDPLAFDPHTESSAIERAERLYVTLGPDAFNAEYQNECRAPDSELTLTPDQVAQRVNGVPRRVLPPGTLALVAFADIGTATKLHWSVLAVGPHRVAAIVDYGVYPPKGNITKKGMTEDAIDKALSTAIMELGLRLYGTTYATARGRPVKLHALWLDRGWKSRTVDAVATRFRQRGYANTYSVKGYDSAHYWQGARSVVARGADVDMRKTNDGLQYAGQNSDVWKEYLQRALQAEPLTPGSVSLFGADPREHAQYAQHLTAEKLVEKVNTSKGLLYRWASARVGAKNHWLDSASGACACASWYRFLDADPVQLPPRRQSAGTAPTVQATRPTGAMPAVRPTAMRPTAKAARAARLARLRRNR